MVCKNNMKYRSIGQKKAVNKDSFQSMN